MNQNFIKLITHFPDSIDKLKNTYRYDIWLLEQEILFKNNFVFYKISHPDMAFILPQSEKSNLFEIICLALKKPLSHITVLKQIIKEEINNIEKNHLLSQLATQDLNFEFYFSNQNLQIFDPINCYLLHYILECQLCIYSMSNSLTLVCKIYNSNFAQTISLFKTSKGMYLLLSSTSVEISENIVLPIIQELLSTINYNKQLPYSQTTSTQYNENNSSQALGLQQLSNLQISGLGSDNSETQNCFTLSEPKQRERRRKQLTFKKSTTQEISLARQQLANNTTLPQNNNIGVFFNSADEQNNDYLLSYDVWANNQNQNKSAISNNSPSLSNLQMDPLDQYYTNMFEQYQQQQILPFNISGSSQENLNNITQNKNMKFQPENYQMNQYFASNSPMEANQQQQFYYNQQQQQQQKINNSQFLPPPKQSQHQLQSFQMNYPITQQPFAQQQNQKKHQILEEPTSERLCGTLKYFDSHKNFGFIKIDPTNQEVFFHYDDICDPVLTKQQLLTFKIGNVMKFSFLLVKYVGKYNNSKKAIDIKLLSQYQVF